MILSLTFRAVKYITCNQWQSRSIYILDKTHGNTSFFIPAKACVGATGSAHVTVEVDWNGRMHKRFDHNQNKGKRLQPLSVKPLHRKQTFKQSQVKQKHVKYGPSKKTMAYSAAYEEEEEPLDKLARVISRYSSKKSAFEAEEENARDTEKQLRFLRSKIIGKKYFKKPSPPSLLFWSAKEQIKFLHQQDPEIWDVERLAESFPVSQKTIEQILKDRRRLHRSEEILQHDKKVKENWDRLRASIEEDSDNAFDESVYQNLRNSSNECLIVNANGIKSSPFPALEIVLSSKSNGPFSKIVRDCVEVKEQVDRYAIAMNDKFLKDKLEDLSQVFSSVSGRSDNTFSKEKSGLKPKQGRASVQPGTLIDLMVSPQPARKGQDESAFRKHKDNCFVTDEDTRTLKSRHASVKATYPQLEKSEKERSSISVSGDSVYDENGDFLYRIP